MDDRAIGSCNRIETIIISTGGVCSTLHRQIVPCLLPIGGALFCVESRPCRPRLARKPEQIQVPLAGRREISVKHSRESPPPIDAGAVHARAEVLRDRPRSLSSY